MSGNFVWDGTTNNIPSPPASIADGAIGEWGLQDLNALNASHIGYQIAFTLGGNVNGQVDFYVASSIDGITIQGGQNEPQTLDRIYPVPLSGDSSGYASPVIILNRPTTGIWPPQLRLKALVTTGSSGITITASKYRIATWVP